MRKEKMIINGKKITYELGGDFFHCSFSFDHPSLALKAGEEIRSVRQRALELGRSIAREHNML